MRSLFHGFTLLVALAVLLPALTAAEPKKEKLIPAGEMTGKLTKLDAGILGRAASPNSRNRCAKDVARRRSSRRPARSL